MGALAVLTGEPQLCRDGFAEVVVPLVHEGCVIGLVTAGCPRPGAFDETDLQLLGMLAELASQRLVLALSHEQGDQLRALRESERRLTAAQRLVGLGTWRMDVRSGEITWSPEMFQLMGLHPETFTPTVDTHRALIHPDDYGRLAQMGEDVQRTRQAQQMVVRTIHSDGDNRLLWNQCDVAFDEAAEVEHLWGTTQDITGREEFPAALAASEQHFRAGHCGGPGRLRHGLLGVGLPAALPSAVPQDRPVVREPARAELAR